MSYQPDFPNCKKKVRKYNKEKETIKIERKDFVEQLMKYRDIIDAQ